MNQTLIATLDRIRRIALYVGIGGLALCVVGLFIDSASVMQSYLFAYLTFVGIGLGCLGVLMIQFTLRAAWGTATRRLLEAGALTIPLMAALFIPIIVGMRALYPWARSEVVAADALLQLKTPYLNVPFFIIRAVVFFAVWSAFAYTLRRWSRREDNEYNPAVAGRLKNLSILGGLVLVITVSFAMIDWFMSLEPAWFSTIYALMVATSGFLATFALVIALVTRLSHIEPLTELLTPSVLNDLGNLLLSALLMWAYLAFSQYLVIWTGNLSDEIPWYLRRLDGGWQVVALLIVVLHFAVPFVLLISRPVKRSARSLGAVAILLLVMHLVESFWLVIPALRQNGLAFSLTDIFAPIGIGGLWVAVFLWQLRQSPLVPLHSQVEAAPHHGEEVPANG